MAKKVQLRRLVDDEIVDIMPVTSYDNLIDKPSIVLNETTDDIPVNKIRSLTRSEYNSLEEVDNNTIYYINDALDTISYNDLTDKPSLFSGNYNDLTNKPSLFSGDYNDLINKPTDLISTSGSASSVSKIWVGTESQYNTIGTKDNNTIYFILE